MSSDITVEVARVMLKLYQDDPYTFKEILVTGTVHRKMMVSTYKLLLAEKAIENISNLPEDKRTKLWTEAKDLAKGRLCNEDCIELSKALHTLEIISQQ